MPSAVTSHAASAAAESAAGMPTTSNNVFSQDGSHKPVEVALPTSTDSRQGSGDSLQRSTDSPPRSNDSPQGSGDSQKRSGDSLQGLGDRLQESGDSPQRSTDCTLSDPDGEQCYNDRIDYGTADRYWSQVPDTLNGMLGGMAHISHIDLNGSAQFIKKLKQMCTAAPPPMGSQRALDCGAGIGRVTRHLLSRHFERVDLVEQCAKFAATARDYLRHTQQLGDIYCCGLQDFSVPAGAYDLIWCQWVLGHLTDDHLVAFLRRCSVGLRANGVIVVKENVRSPHTTTPSPPPPPPPLAPTESSSSLSDQCLPQLEFSPPPPPLPPPSTQQQQQQPQFTSHDCENAHQTSTTTPTLSHHHRHLHQTEAVTGTGMEVVDGDDSERAGVTYAQLSRDHTTTTTAAAAAATTTAAVAAVVDYDAKDSSVTRPLQLWQQLFARANLQQLTTQVQRGFPRHLYQVRMFALRRADTSHR